MSDIHIINVQEIENLIPTKLFEDIVKGNEERRSFVNWINVLEKREFQSRLFIDVKKGFSLKKMINNEKVTNKPEAIKYWGNVFKSELNSCEVFQSGTCIDAPCRCVIISGMGDPLPEVIDNIEKLSSQKLEETSRSNPEINEKWEELSEKFLYWFCADDPI